jgi:hypothetical protein
MPLSTKKAIPKCHYQQRKPYQNAIINKESHTKMPLSTKKAIPISTSPI